MTKSVIVSCTTPIPPPEEVQPTKFKLLQFPLYTPISGCEREEGFTLIITAGSFGTNENHTDPVKLRKQGLVIEISAKAPKLLNSSISEQ